jgi:DNA-binding NarL/FixJ family response regulator
MNKPRVLIADDQRLFAAGLECLLAQHCRVVATVFDFAMLIEEARRLRPDLVIQGLSSSPIIGAGLIRELRDLLPQTQVIVVTLHDDPTLAGLAFRSGAAAYLLKSSDVSELLDAVRCVVDRKSYVTPRIAGGMIQSLTSPLARVRDQQLTDRQRTVLRLLAEGKSMKEVASALNLTVRTVAFHKYRMMHMLKIKSSAELVRFAVARQIV